MLKDKPFLFLNIDTEKCAYEVRLNDVPVMEHIRGSIMTVEVPVNLYLFSGENVLDMRVGLPPNSTHFLENATSKVSLMVRPILQPGAPPVTITSINFVAKTASVAGGFGSSPPGGNMLSEARFKRDDKGDVAVSGVSVLPAKPPFQSVASRKINMALPFPQWIWKTSKVIENNSQTRESLMSEYQAFWSLANAKRKADALEMCRQNLTDVAAAFFCNREEAEDKIEIGDMVASDELTLQPIRKAEWLLEVFGNGRLARIVDRKGHSPIAFLETDGSAVHYVPFMFCKTDRGWRAVR